MNTLHVLNPLTISQPSSVNAEVPIKLMHWMRNTPICHVELASFSYVSVHVSSIRVDIKVSSWHAISYVYLPSRHSPSVPYSSSTCAMSTQSAVPVQPPGAQCTDTKAKYEEKRLLIPSRRSTGWPSVLLSALAEFFVDSVPLSWRMCMVPSLSGSIMLNNWCELEQDVLLAPYVSSSPLEPCTALSISSGSSSQPWSFSRSAQSFVQPLQP